MRVAIMGRSLFEDEEELEPAKKAGFDVRRYFDSIDPYSYVIPRFLTEPFSEDFFNEALNNNVNIFRGFDENKRPIRMTHSEYVHSYAMLPPGESNDTIIIPKTYTDPSRLPEGQYVVKGLINSKKYCWEDSMYAATRQDAIRVMCRLQDDTLIGRQPIIFKEYIPLVKLDEAPRGLPITVEFRFFFLGNREIESGFYWASHPEAEVFMPDVVRDASRQMAQRYVNYHNADTLVSFDLALSQEGRAVFIEHNSFYMTGLGLIFRDRFYSSLKEALDDR